jgi:hypothetical protein
MGAEAEIEAELEMDVEFSIRAIVSKRCSDAKADRHG